MLAILILGAVFGLFMCGSWHAFRVPDYEEVFITQKDFADGHSEFEPYVIFYGRSFWRIVPWKEKVGVHGSVYKRGLRAYVNDCRLSSTEDGSSFPSEELARTAVKEALDLRKAKQLRETLISQKRL